MAKDELLKVQWAGQPTVSVPPSGQVSSDVVDFRNYEKPVLMIKSTAPAGWMAGDAILTAYISEYDGTNKETTSSFDTFNIPISSGQTSIVHQSLYKKKGQSIIDIAADSARGLSFTFINPSATKTLTVEMNLYARPIK